MSKMVQNSKTTVHDDSRRHQLKHAFAGATAGAVGSILTCPLEVIKTLMQVESGSKKYSSITIFVNKYDVESFRTVHLEEGVRGLYKGLGTTLLALIPNWAIYWVGYHEMKHWLVVLGQNEKYQSTAGVYFQPQSALTHMTAAAAAAIVTDAAVNPLWMIKTRIQTQQMIYGYRKYRNTFHAATVIVREEGFLALYKGMLPQMLGVVHVAVQFPLYERLKIFLATRRGEYENVQLSPFEFMMASAVAKTVASVVAYPHEVLRSRMQSQSKTSSVVYKGIGNAIQTIHRTEGIAGFYRGLTANLIRVAPTTAIVFSAYEMMLRFLVDR